MYYEVVGIEGNKEIPYKNFDIEVDKREVESYASQYLSYNDEVIIYQVIEGVRHNIWEKGEKE